MTELGEGLRWEGLRWQASFTAPGAPYRPVVDATTGPEAHGWAIEVARRLERAGHVVRLGQDEGEGADGEPTLYDELAVTVGAGHLSLAFFSSEVFWSVALSPDQCDAETAARAVRDVVAAVEPVTGYVLRTASLPPAARTLLGRT